MNHIQQAQEKAKKNHFEMLAHIQHEIWSHWMEYLFSVSKDLGEHGTFIPPEHGDRWGRQMNNFYSELTEKEKQSDRSQVEKFWHVIENIIAQTIKDTEERIEGVIKSLIDEEKTNREIVDSIENLKQKHY